MNFLHRATSQQCLLAACGYTQNQSSPLPCLCIAHTFALLVTCYYIQSDLSLCEVWMRVFPITLVRRMIPSKVYLLIQTLCFMFVQFHLHFWVFITAVNAFWASLLTHWQLSNQPSPYKMADVCKPSEIRRCPLIWIVLVFTMLLTTVRSMPHAQCHARMAKCPCTRHNPL